MPRKAMANPMRGEADLLLDGRTISFRPTFHAIASAEDELGSLIALAVAAAERRVTLTQMVALLWHCRPEGMDNDRGRFSESVVAVGVEAMGACFRALLTAIFGAPNGR